MTIDTIESNWFIVNDLFAICQCCILMAFVAGNLLVRSVQEEPGIAVVVEYQRFPALRCMAMAALANIILGKLPAMDIFMTIETLDVNRF